MSAHPPKSDKPDTPSNFIRDIIDHDQQSGKYHGRVVTRFPPEPNGYPHIGHGKSICLNFGIARDYAGVCHLRFDDTNPTTEDVEYVNAIQRDVRWLGFDWGDKLFYASDYFPRLYEMAQRFVREGKAYVCSLSEDEISEYRGTVTEAGRPSPYRSRAIEENLTLLEGMRRGDFAEGSHVLRAKIDMTNPNMKMRDPLMYRIKKAHHYRTGDAWSIYPMYDFAHCFSDAFERITHSLCTLEFENNRELYDWFLAQAGIAEAPEQIEFARGNLDYTVVSKRKLLELVRDKHVNGWDDPRMPTLAALRRRGYTPESIRHFWELVGVAKANSSIDMGKLEFAIRDDLNSKAKRVLCVLRPLKVVIENFPEGKLEWLDAPYFPKGFAPAGSSATLNRQVPFTRHLYIEQGDFAEHPAKDFQRLSPGKEVRLRYGYIIKCESFVRDASGALVELRCSYDAASAHGQSSDGRKVKGIIHWVSAEQALTVEARLYDRLFTHPRPDEGEDHFTKYLNPDSLVIVPDARIEPSIKTAKPGDTFQFEREGFFCVDSDATGEKLVFNRTVTLKDSWATKNEEPGRSEAPRRAPPQAVKPAKKEIAKKERSADPATVARAAQLVALGMASDQAEILAVASEVTDFFSAANQVAKNAKALAPWVVNEVLRELKEQTLSELRFSPAALGQLVVMVEGGELSRRAGKDVLAAMFSEGGEPQIIAKRLGLTQMSDSAELLALVKQVLANQTESVNRLRAGESKLLGFLVGQVLKLSGGRANPQLVNDLVKQQLGLG